jgi:cytochrome c553
MAAIDKTTHKPGPTLYMQKDTTGAGWRYSTLETSDPKSDGLALCARCHAEAPGDHVFALPE